MSYPDKTGKVIDLFKEYLLAAEEQKPEIAQRIVIAGRAVKPANIFDVYAKNTAEMFVPK